MFAAHEDTRDAPGVSGGQGCCTTRKRKPISNSLINSPSRSLSLSLILRRHFFRHEDHLNNLHFKEALSVMMLLLLLLVRPAPVVTRTRTYRGICLAAGNAFSSFSSSSCCCVAFLPKFTVIDPHRRQCVMKSSKYAAPLSSLSGHAAIRSDTQLAISDTSSGNFSIS